MDVPGLLRWVGEPGVRVHDSLTVAVRTHSILSMYSAHHNYVRKLLKLLCKGLAQLLGELRVRHTPGSGVLPRQRMSVGILRVSYAQFLQATMPILNEARCARDPSDHANSNPRHRRWIATPTHPLLSIIS